MRLGIKFAIAFFIGSVVSILFVYFLTYTLVGKSLQEAIVQEQQELARETISNVDRFLYDRREGITAIAQSEAIISFVQFKSAFPTNDDTLSREKVRNIIATLSPATGPWKDIDILDRTGTVLFSEFSHTIGETSATEHESTLFALAMKGRISVSDVLQDPENKQETVLFAAPIFNSDVPGSAPIGVVIGHVAWDHLLSILMVSDTKTIELYNRDGELIGDNNPQHVPGSFLRKTSYSAYAVALAQKKDEKTHIDSGEVISSVSESGFETYMGNHWVLFLRVPVQTAFASAAHTAIIVASILLPVIVVVNALLLLFILGLLQPLFLIGDTAQDIAKGNLTRRVSYSGNDEIGWLAQSFNTMADTLQESYQGLERKVQEKTRELSEKMEDSEAMNSFMIKRELKLIELKKQVAELKDQLAKKNQGES